ncbi:MAG: hypothetical protein JXR31_10475 [Prolixibacteraceae bacterium]|nr:hypothetical protein [Prolixibacteraceae bacterium]MBN2774664.1 hypothetical protein [Prolixibacteraceae bacterium]
MILLTGLTVNPARLYAQIETDTTETELKYKEKYDRFYDSLRYKAQRRDFTRWLHNLIIHIPKEYIDKEQLTLSYFTPFKDKTIGSIEVKALDVFGPSFEDTTRKAKSKFQKFANDLHTKTNLNIIRKNLLFDVGDKLDPDLLYENERIIRSLSYIKDVRFFLSADSLNPELVNVTVLTKDVFAFGVTGSASGLSTATFEIYNQNIFGAGHEVSIGMVGHIHREPYLGFETFYRIPNIKGKFINFSFGFSNTYRKEGLSLDLEKEFILPSTKWGGGLSALRLTRSDRITENDPVRLDEAPLDFTFIRGWAGRTFQLNNSKYNNSQITLSANILNRKFNDRPLPDEQNKQYFSNSTFYIAGLTWSRRKYMRDQLVYGYGITEDIPEGFKHEMVFGYNADEFGDRYYAHLLISNGNMMPRRPGYLYISAGIGSYFNKLEYELGMVSIKANYISKLITAGDKRYRFFARMNYTLGIKRYDLENLLIKYGGHIRGFVSSQPVGNQRLSLNLEAVFFQHREIYNFNIAFYTFSDIAIIGSNKSLIFKEDYYAGIGAGIRLHNESLVLKTIDIRLAFYPNHPNNMGFVGFVLEEQVKKDFYSFQPGAPLPLRFE